jgi:hypothetical protein
MARHGEAGTVKRLTLLVGAVLILAGTTFGLQGVGLVGGSAMSGKPLWEVIGSLLALVGVVVLVRGGRGRATASAGRPEEDDTPG